MPTALGGHGANYPGRFWVWSSCVLLGFELKSGFYQAYREARP
jgi:hypothetical protein